MVTGLSLVLAPLPPLGLVGLLFEWSQHAFAPVRHLPHWVPSVRSVAGLQFLAGPVLGVFPLLPLPVRLLALGEQVMGRVLAVLGDPQPRLAGNHTADRVNETRAEPNLLSRRCPHEQKHTHCCPRIGYLKSSLAAFPPAGLYCGDLAPTLLCSKPSPEWPLLIKNRIVFRKTAYLPPQDIVEGCPTGPKK